MIEGNVVDPEYLAIVELSAAIGAVVVVDYSSTVILSFGTALIRRRNQAVPNSAATRTLASGDASGAISLSAVYSTTER